MKLINTIIPLAALATAFVIPDEQTAEQLVLESKKAPSFLEKLKDDANDIWSHAETKVKDAIAFSENALDSAIDAATGAGKKAASSLECYESMLRFETQEWLDSAISAVDDIDVRGGGDHDHPPHDGPPHDGPPHDGPPHDGPPHDGPPHHGPPHRRPHHDPHQKPNQTVYELIASSKYTTKLAKLINEYPDLVKTLNGTKANYTVFAPTDKAFEKLPSHHKPSKELIERVLTYHVSTDFYPAGRILLSHTIPTALEEEALGGPQRLRVGLGLKGLAVNFYSKIVAVDIFGTNGVIHGIDSLLLPPPPALKIVELLPGEFSTLQLALIKTGLFEEISKANHTGGTLFAPSNFAFKKLGPRINAFLFSKYGEKYLKALLEYHVVANQTLYSDAFYKAKGETTDIPKGHFHIDLPTLLKDKSLSIDIARWGGFITIKINGFGSIAVQDGIAKDGVIHVVSNVLIPPKTPGGAAEEVEGEMDVEEFKERLLPTSSSVVSQEL